MKIFFGFFNPFFLCVLDKGYNSIETAENMIRKEYPFDEIVEITGLALEKVKELAESITVKV